MAKLLFGIAPASVKFRVKLMDSSKTDGSGLTGLAYNSSGLIISTIQNIRGANGEASATIYTAAASNIETITTLGTYAAPTSNKCRFKEVDATNHPGVYEIQLADARLSANGDATKAMTLLTSIIGATNLAQCDVEIECQNASVNVIQIAGTAQTARDIGASVLLSSGSGAGQLDVTSGVVKSNLSQILGTALTETAGYLAAGFKKFFNIATPVATVESINQTGDSYAIVNNGTYGNSALHTEVAKDATVMKAASYVAPDNADIVLIKAKTDNLPTSPAAVGSAMTLAANAVDASQFTQAAADKVWGTAARTLTSFGTLVADIWGAGTRTLTSFGTLVADTASAVWSAVSRTLTSISGLTADANLVSIDGQATTGNNATLNLKKLSIKNNGDSAISISANDANAIAISSTGSGGAGIIIQGSGSGSGLNIVGGVDGNGITVYGGTSMGNGLNIYAGKGIGLVVAGKDGGAQFLGAENSDGVQMSGAGSGSGLILQRGGSGGHDLTFATPDCTVPVVTDVTNAVPANLTKILGTALTETAGYLAAAFKKFFNVATPTLTTAGVNQTGDSYAIVNDATFGNSALHTEVAKDATVMKAASYTAPDNTNIANIHSIVKSGGTGDNAAIKAQTDKLNFTGNDVKATLDGEQVTVATNNDKTGYSISGTKQTLDALNDVSASDVWSYATRTLSSFGTLIADIWTYITRTLTSVTGLTVDSNVTKISGASIDTSLAQIGVNVVKIKGTASAGTAGYVGTDQANIANPTTTVDLSGTTIKTLDEGVSVTGTVTLDDSATNKDIIAEGVLTTPANKLATDSSGRVTVGSNADKTGYSISGTKTTLDALHDVSTSDIWSYATRTLSSFGTLIADIWGYVTRTLTSVSGLTVDSNVTKIAGSDVNTGSAQLGVNVVTQENIDFGALQKASLNAATPASVGSVTSPVTVGTNNDKTGYSISGTKQTLDVLHDIQAADVWSVTTRTLTSYGTLVSDIATAVWGATTRTLSSFGSLVSDVSAAVWGAVTRSLTDKADFTLTSAYDHAKDNVLTPLAAVKADTGSIKLKTDNLPADPASNTEVDTRLAAADYIAPNNAGISAIKAQTDKLTFTGSNVNAQIKASDDIDFTPTQVETLETIIATGSVGVYKVTLTFLDQYSAPIEMVTVYVLNSGGHYIASGLSNSSGILSFNVDAGTYTVRSYKAMVSIPDTVITISADTPQTISGTVKIPTPPAVGMQTVYGWVKHGDAAAGYQSIVTAVPLFDTSINNQALTLKEITTVVDTDGYFELGLIQSASYQMSIKYSTKVLSSKQFRVTTDDTRAYEDYIQ
jgi:hypothetical protein